MQLYLYKREPVDEFPYLITYKAQPRHQLLCTFHALKYWPVPGQAWLTKDGKSYLASTLVSDWLFTVQEVATFLHLSRQRVYVLLRNGRLPGCKRSGAFFVKGCDMIAFAAQERPPHRPKK